MKGIGTRNELTDEWKERGVKDKDSAILTDDITKTWSGKITVENTEISIILQPQSNDYISLTDMAKYKDNDPNAAVVNCLRNRNTLEYLGVWEYLHNPNFNPLEFEGGGKEQSAPEPIPTISWMSTKWSSILCPLLTQAVFAFYVYL